MNKIVILGATGRTGYHLVEQALALGYEVVAYVRSPEKLAVQDKKLHIVSGELHEQAKLEAAVQGAVAVVSGLGPVPKAKERPLSAGMQVVVAAMKAVGVERLIVSTGAGVGDPQDRPTVVDKVIKFLLKTISKDVFADSMGMVDVVRQSGLKWTIVRAPRLLDKPAVGQVQVGYLGDVGIQLTRADFARFLLEQIEGEKWLGQAPVVSN